ncbi:hypothetical protein ES703_18489 [subsurface metagenome]
MSISYTDFVKDRGCAGISGLEVGLILDILVTVMPRPNLTAANIIGCIATSTWPREVPGRIIIIGGNLKLERGAIGNICTP